MKTYSLFAFALAAWGVCAQDAPLPPVSIVPLDPLPDVPTQPDRYFINLAGGYAFSRDRDMPGMPGVVLEVGVRGKTWKILHEGFLSFGYYTGTDNYTFEEARDRFGIEAWYDDRYHSSVRHEVESMPLTVGYRLAVPLGRSGISLFAGARYGISYFRDAFVQPAWCHCCDKDDWWDDDDDRYRNCDRSLGKKTSFKSSWALDGGVRIALSDTVELAVGYEYYRIGSMKPWHIVQAGVTWSF